jgi:hypothetical protein
MAAANAQIGVAEAAYYPSLTLNATGGFQNSLLTELLSWPSRFWALGPALIAQTIFDAGLRKAQSAQAVAAYDATVATYRQTVLNGFQEVEDNLASLRILEQEAAFQDTAVRAAREAAAITLNQYKAGIANYLAVVVLQNAALNSERTSLGILGRRLSASVNLIRALGGGWNASDISNEPRPRRTTRVRGLRVRSPGRIRATRFSLRFNPGYTGGSLRRLVPLRPGMPPSLGAVARSATRPSALARSASPASLTPSPAQAAR